MGVFGASVRSDAVTSLPRWKLLQNIGARLEAGGIFLAALPHHIAGMLLFVAV
jgi:hypothetical protein